MSLQMISYYPTFPFVVANDFLLSDVPKEKFFNKLRGFVAAAGPHQSAKSGSLSVMDKIRSAALYNARLAIAAENNKENITMSLHELSKQTDADCQKRNIPVSQIEKILRTTRTAKNEIDLVNNDLNLPFAVNCFLCSSSTPPPPSQEQTDGTLSQAEFDQHFHSQQQQQQQQSGYVFRDETIKRFNAIKAIPLDTLDEVIQHMSLHHRAGGDIAVGKAGDHRHLLLCRICSEDPKLTHEQFLCCLSHFQDHNRETHSSQMPHLSLFKALKRENLIEWWKPSCWLNLELCTFEVLNIHFFVVKKILTCNPTNY